MSWDKHSCECWPAPCRTRHPHGGQHPFHPRIQIGRAMRCWGSFKVVFCIVTAWASMSIPRTDLAGKSGHQGQHPVPHPCPVQPAFQRTRQHGRRHQLGGGVMSRAKLICGDTTTSIPSTAGAWNGAGEVHVNAPFRRGLPPWDSPAPIGRSNFLAPPWTCRRPLRQTTDFVQQHGQRRVHLPFLPMGHHARADGSNMSKPHSPRYATATSWPAKRLECQSPTVVALGRSSLQCCGPAKTPESRGIQRRAANQPPLSACPKSSGRCSACKTRRTESPPSAFRAKGSVNHLDGRVHVLRLGRGRRLPVPIGPTGSYATTTRSKASRANPTRPPSIGHAPPLLAVLPSRSSNVSPQQNTACSPSSTRA